MKISANAWNSYQSRLGKLHRKAGEEMIAYINKVGYDNPKALVNYGYGLVKRYGKASAELAAQMYDALAEVQNVVLEPAEIAELPMYKTFEKDFYSTAKYKNPTLTAGNVIKHVKKMGADTTIKNGRRDGAEFAWIPSGDTCAFCEMLAANGWQYTLATEHKDHIHPHCDCTYAVRFSPDVSVAGYNPDEFKAKYDAAEGDTWKEKLHSMQRKKYAKNADEINERKRQNYADRKARDDNSG